MQPNPETIPGLGLVACNGVLAFEAGGADTLDQVALEGDEYDKHRQQRQTGHGKDRAPIRANVGIGIGPDRQRDGVEMGILQIEQGTEKVLPRPVERKDGCRDQSRLDQRQDDLEEYAYLAASIDLGCLVQFDRYTTHELHQQKDEESVAKEAWEQQWQEGVDPFQLAKHNVLGDHQNLSRQHHGEQHDREPESPAHEFDLGESIGDDGRGGNPGYRAKAGVDERVSPKGGERDTAKPCPPVDVMLKRDPAGYQ